MNLGENIYKYRTQKNLSQGDLADSLDVSRQSVSKWENNNAVPELEKLVKMSELFGISLDELVGKDAPPALHQEKPRGIDLTNVPPRKIIGIVLLICALLVLYIQQANHTGFYWVLPYAVCGIICLKCHHHAGFLCLYALYLFAWLPMGVLAPNYIRLGFAKAIQLIHILWGTALLFYGLRLKKRGTFLKAKPGTILFAALLGTTILISFLILLFPGLLPTPGLKHI